MTAANVKRDRTQRTPVRRHLRTFVFVFTACILGALVGCQLFFVGPYQTPQPLPKAKLLDIHCHTAGIGAGGSGCFISKKMETSWKLRHYLKSFGTTRQEL